MPRIRTSAEALGMLGVPALLLSLLLALSLAVGPALSWSELWSGTSTSQLILWELRLPRALTAALVGACLAGSGAVIQSLLRNPLAGPEVLGVSAGAGAGALTMLVLLPVAGGPGLLVVGALFGATLTATLAIALATRQRSTSLSAVILAGMALSSLLSAVTTLLLLTSHETQVSQFLFWLLGSLENRRWTHVVTLLPLALVALAIMVFGASRLNPLALGEGTARSLGLRVQVLKVFMLGAVVVATAGAVSVSGAIGFLGLLVPHSVRLLWGHDARWVVWLSILWGAAFLVACDTLVRWWFGPVEVPVGILTALLGAPLFVAILVRSAGHREAGL